VVRNKNDLEIKEYNDLLKSGMFWEFYPQLSGDLIRDKDE